MVDKTSQFRDDERKSNQLALSWAQFRAVFVPHDAAPQQIADMRTTFFAGAFAIHEMWLKAVQAKNFTAVTALSAELAIVGATLRAATDPVHMEKAMKGLLPTLAAGEMVNYKRCPDCGGTGEIAEPATGGTRICRSCGGTGKVLASETAKPLGGEVRTYATCSYCNGKGVSGGCQCHHCNGTGRVLAAE